MIRILETNVAIDFLRRINQIIDAKIRNLISEGIEFTITHITLCELWYGVHLLPSKQKQILESKKLNEFISNLPEIFSLNIPTCKIFGEIGAELDKAGFRVPQFDLLNASIAISNKAILITKEKKHFEKIRQFSEYAFLEIWEY